MTVSKHVSQLFDFFRQSKTVHCKKGNEEVVVLKIDTYPDDGEENIIFLENGKNITIYDLEFANIEGTNRVVLGDYVFSL